LRSGAAQILIDQILKFSPAPLEAGGRDIGDIVRNDFDIRLLGLHARRGDLQGTHGGSVLFHLMKAGGA
jgi:hypothetical protein